MVKFLCQGEKAGSIPAVQTDPPLLSYLIIPT